jgi:hypothetical protein
VKKKITSCPRYCWNLSKENSSPGRFLLTASQRSQKNTWARGGWGLFGKVSFFEELRGVKPVRELQRKASGNQKIENRPLLNKNLHEICAFSFLTFIVLP